ncbi:hypothetical protein B4125_0145 [Bacillus paralicheniformis]|nr:hypothetical protein B4125_0145 [Bacillus paralicheniformis]
MKVVFMLKVTIPSVDVLYVNHYPLLQVGPKLLETNIENLIY